MSTKLYWRVPPGDERLGYALKWALAPQLWDHDGSLSGDWVLMLDRDLPFLRGIIAGRKDDDEVRVEGERLIALIEQHGKVEVCLRG